MAITSGAFWTREDGIEQNYSVKTGGKWHDYTAKEPYVVDENQRRLEPAHERLRKSLIEQYGPHEIVPQAP